MDGELLPGVSVHDGVAQEAVERTVSVCSHHLTRAEGRETEGIKYGFVCVCVMRVCVCINVG